MRFLPLKCAWVSNSYRIHTCKYCIFTHSNTLTQMHTLTLKCAHSYACKCTNISIECVHKNMHETTPYQASLSYIIAQVSYKCFMLRLSFASLWESVIFFQSQSSVFPVHLGDVLWQETACIRNYSWLSSSSSALFGSRRFGFYTCMKQVQLLLTLKEGLQVAWPHYFSSSLKAALGLKNGWCLFIQLKYYVK